MKRLIKPLLLVSLSTLICVLLLLVFLVFYNNCCKKTIDVEALQHSHNASVQWLIQNEEKLITEHNPILWEMIDKTAELTHNSTLQNLFSRYQRQFFSFYRTHPFGFLMNGYNKANFLTTDLSVFPYYNLFFMYGFTCDKALADFDIVQAQRDINFCSKYFSIAPACKTHQMIGFMYLKNTTCENPQWVADNLEILANDIKGQLFYDFRLVDVYLQRVMILYENDNSNLVNPQWLVNIIAAQNIDGGWDDFQPIIALSNQKYLGVGAKSIYVKTIRSTFHATVQGAYLTALALKDLDL